MPLFERKALLKKIIADIEVQFSESFEVDGLHMFSRMPARSLRKASSQKYAIAATPPAASMTG